MASSVTICKLFIFLCFFILLFHGSQSLDHMLSEKKMSTTIRKGGAGRGGGGGGFRGVAHGHGNHNAANSNANISPAFLLIATSLDHKLSEKKMSTTIRKGGAGRGGGGGGGFRGVTRGGHGNHNAANSNANISLAFLLIATSLSLVVSCHAF